MKYRVFTNDIGPKQYSAFCMVDAASKEEAEQKAFIIVRGSRNADGRWVEVLVIPDNRKDLMPDGKTGRLPK